MNMLWLSLLGCLLLAVTGSFSVQAQVTDGGDLQAFSPSWVLRRSSDFALNFTAADSAVQQQEGGPIVFRGKPLQNVSARKGYFHGNLAVVRFGNQFIMAVRKIQFYITPRSAVADYPVDDDPKKQWISWWTNRISLCTADPGTLQPKACTDFDPRNWTDCMWNGGFETLGPEDARLIIWPSKGLFVMFNSKPWPVNPAGTKPDETHCSGPWAQQPWLFPLTTYTGGLGPVSGSVLDGAQQQQQQQDPWTKGLIRLQYLPPELHGEPQELLKKLQKLHGSSGPFLHKQKNWNPFIYNDQLYFSQSFMPHVVIKPEADGTCNMVHMTDGLVFKHLAAKPRGNTQAVLLPAAVSGYSKTAYLGIVHTEVERKYESYLYLMEAEPPFDIMAVSSALPLVPGQHPRVPAWDHISFPMSLQLLEDTNQLLIGYGSGDQVPRIKLLPLEEALALFKGLSSTTAQQHQQQRSSSSDHVQAAATDPVMVDKVAGKLAALSPRAQAAAQAALSAVKEAMKLTRPAKTDG